MKVVFFCHPSFEKHQSMPRFARMLSDSFKSRGWEVEEWAPVARFHRLPAPGFMRKWLGYIDQYLVFPLEVWLRVVRGSENTLYSFTDQALGPWVPLVKNHAHVIHCHDFLAQQSALGMIPENPVSSTGRIYQNYIRWGYSQGRNFISVSEKTREDLHSFLDHSPLRSEVVYNGLNQQFQPQDKPAAASRTGDALGLDLKNGYILHVGGDQWYKNRSGVIEVYEAWRALAGDKALPLLMIGPEPPPHLVAMKEASAWRNDIHFCRGISDSTLRDAYAGASLFLFPSLAEGFGWPIAEAMACGIRVVTTGLAPMSEVGGSAAYYLRRRQPVDPGWANEGGQLLQEIFSQSAEDRQSREAASLQQAGKFEAGAALDAYEEIYRAIAAEEITTGTER